MVDVIKWCFELGVAHVSVYAFSLENFRRGADEVEGLMRLAADKFDELARVSGGAETSVAA
jgi:ditrans,polycis-polyprenyl diphosphate synthase